MIDLEKFQSALQTLRMMREDLRQLADSFDRTGNERVADELYGYVRQLDTAGQDLRGGYDTLQKDSLRAAQENVAGLLMVAMKMDQLEGK